MVLPLHQRLQLIRTQRGCSTSEARRVLWDPNGEFRDPWTYACIQDDSQSGHADNIETETGERKVDMENVISKGCTGAGFSEVVKPCVLAVHPGIDGSVLMCAPGTGLRSFTFNSVFGEKSEQTEVSFNSVQRLVVSFMNGKNACVMAYGQVRLDLILK